MSDTPRTDEAEASTMPTMHMVRADFARTLERCGKRLSEIFGCNRWSDLEYGTENAVEDVIQSAATGKCELAAALNQIEMDTECIERIRTHGMQTEVERDLALAANAALRETLLKICRTNCNQGDTAFTTEQRFHYIANAALSTPAPGAALLAELEELRKINMTDYTEAGWYRAKELENELAPLRQRAMPETTSLKPHFIDYIDEAGRQWTSTARFIQLSDQLEEQLSATQKAQEERDVALAQAVQARTTRRAFQELATKKHQVDASTIANLTAECDALREDFDWLEKTRLHGFAVRRDA